MSRMQPLSIDDCADPELREMLEHFVNTLGFVPNSLLTMQRVPGFAKSVIQMNRAVFARDGRVDLGLKRLVAHMASFAAGCQYCKAHTTVSATRHGIDEEKMAAVYEYRTNPLFDDRERAAFVLRHYQDRSMQEIADAMDIAVGTVKSLLFRSTRKMRTALAPVREDWRGTA